MNLANLDARALPKSWPAALRESTEAARAIRSNPVVKLLVESILIERSTGIPDDYARLKLAELGVKPNDVLPRAKELLELSEGAGWKTSPLTVGLSLSHRMDQQYAVAPHLREISDAICAAYNGTGPRAVVVSLPARMGKTEIAGRRTLEHFFANYPGFPAIYLTATEDAGGSLGRLVRNDIALHGEVFGFELADDSSAAGRFNTNVEGGQMISSGIFGQVVGKGAALMVCDDFFKNGEQASSAVYRDTVWDLWQTAFQARLQSGAVLVVIGTRFHSSDFIGRLLNGHEGTTPLDARYIRFPALDDSGEPLSTGPVQVPGFGYSKQELEERRASVSADVWATCYQQIPADETSLNKAYKFDPAIHVREVDFDPTQTLYVSADFNISPWSAVLAQVREPLRLDLADVLTNRRPRTLEVVTELSLADCTTAEAASELVELLRKIAKGRKLKIKVTGDASGNSRKTSANSTNDTDWSIFQDVMSRYSHLFSVTYDIRDANPSVRERVAKLNSFLAPADGTVKFVVDPRCRVLINDLAKVTWARDASLNVRDTLSKKDARLTHSSDALGYLAWIVGNEARYGELPWSPR